MQTTREFTAAELKLIADALDTPLANTIASASDDVKLLSLWAHFANLAEAAREEEARQGRSFAHSPDRCPSKHWNDGDDICADCGTDLN